MKTLYNYIQESIFDIEDKVEKFDSDIWNELLKPLKYWKVGSDGKTIICDTRTPRWGSDSLYIDNDDEIDIKALAESNLKFQPIRDLCVLNTVDDWEKLPITITKDTVLRVIVPDKIDLTKIGWEIEAKLSINIERDIDTPKIIPPKQHLKLVALSTNYNGYDLDEVKDWDCDLLCVLSKKDTQKITWDGFQGYNEDRINRFVSNNPKAKTIYLIPNSYDDVVYRIQTKGTGKNKKCSGLLPVSRKSLTNRIDKYNIGTFKYMSFKHDHPELYK